MAMGWAQRFFAGYRVEGSGPVAELVTLGTAAVVQGRGAVRSCRGGGPTGPRSCWEHRCLWGSWDASGLAVHTQGYRHASVLEKASRAQRRELGAQADPGKGPWVGRGL